MAENAIQNQEQTQEVRKNDTEYNFRALEAKHRREIEQERNARLELEEKIKQMNNVKHVEEDDDGNDPYVDSKRLEKKLNKFGQQTQSEIQKSMEFVKNQAKEELRQEMWLDKNKDFEDVMKHAEKIYDADSELADTILKMPNNFERQKLVYRTVKSLGLHQEKKQPSIQDKIDANRHTPYYQPSGVGTAPYAQSGDFSISGQKNAYAKMQELKARIQR